jgi:hypothetical protein
MRSRAILVPLFMVVAFVVGCTQPTPTPTPTSTDDSIAALPADQILAKAKEALKATTYHVKGSPAPYVTADMYANGDDTKGTFIGFSHSVQVIYVSKDLYLKANDDFWQQNIPADKQPLVLPLIRGKWAKVNAADPAYANYVPSLDSLFQLIGTPTKGDATTINGTPAITLLDSSGAKFYVATQGAPVVLRIESPGSLIDITEFGSAITVEAPAASDVVDLTPFTS